MNNLPNFSQKVKTNLGSLHSLLNKNEKTNSSKTIETILHKRE